MKKTIIFFGFIFTLFVCVRCTTDSELPTETTVEEQSNGAITLMYDGETNELLPDAAIVESKSCGGIIFETFTLQPPDINGCCKIVLNIITKDKQPIRVFVDGAFYGGGASSGASYLIPICGVPKLVQVYSDGALCYSKVLSCKDRCCDQVDYTIESRWVDGCCIFTFTLLRNQIDCNNIQYGYTKLGGPQIDFEVIDGNPTFTAYLCDGDDQVRFFISDNTSGQRCKATSWFNNNSCVP